MGRELEDLYPWKRKAEKDGQRSFRVVYVEQGKEEGYPQVLGAEDDCRVGA